MRPYTPVNMMDSYVSAVDQQRYLTFHYIHSSVRPHLISTIYIYLLWFKFILALMFFELVSILFAIVPDYGTEYVTKEIKIEPVLKILHQN